MAEIVAKNLEATLEELELVQEYKLLSKDEVKKLVEVRKEYENKLVKPKKSKRDFISYINYEANLLKLIILRRKLLNVEHGRNQIDRAISLRVVRRLRFITRTWPQDLNLWELRRKFCRLHGYQEEVTNSYLEQLAYHGNKEHLWVSFARWHLEFLNDPTKAREILLMQAKEYHPNSLYISRECFRLELILAQQKLASIEEEADEPEDKVPDCKVAEVVYEDAKENFEGDEIFLEFYKVAGDFTFAKDFQERIFSEMQELYPKGISTCRLIMSRFIDKESYTLEQNLGEILEKLDEIYEYVGSPFHSVYIRELLHYLQYFWGEDTMTNTIKCKILNLLEEDEDLELNLFQLLLKFEVLKLDNAAGRTLLATLEECSDDLEGNELIQLKVLETKVSQKETDEEKMKVFHRTVKKMDRALAKEAWLHALDCLKEKDNKIKLCEQGSIQELEVAHALRLKLLETDDMAHARNMYEKHYLDSPAIAQFHINMIVKELQLPKPSLKIVRLAFQTLTRQFGKQQIGLWLSYAEFELQNSGVIQSRKILDEGQKQLDPKLIDHYISTKTLMLIDQKSNSKLKPSSKTKKVCTDWDLSQFFGEPLKKTICDERDQFFLNLSRYQNFEKSKLTPCEKQASLDTEWEEVLELLGRTVSLEEPKNQVEGPSVEKDAEKFLNEQLSHKDEKAKLKSYPLDTSSGPSTSTGPDEISNLLKDSDILTPDFEAQKDITPYWRSWRSMKKERKAKYEETAGEGWFNMKPTKVTPEIEKDLVLLKNRSVLDPKRHYKKSDMKHMPKYFQVGKVQDNPFDFYSDRLPKKLRKRTFVEEVMANEEVLKYQKKKYQEVLAESKRFKKRFKRSSKE